MTGNKPTLIAYSVKERGKGKTAIWTRIGAAWPFESGQAGFTVQLEALPIGDRIVLAEPKAEAEGEGA
jgi:hypothetical protein